MISVVAELKKQPDNRLKRIKLAFGINGAILLHRPAYTPHNWIYQLIDFFNVADFPIEAYEPFALVSEIQGHMWNLAIEYRPKYFPYRAFVDIGYCSLSSNIIYPMTGCTLRVLTEDCIFSLGPVVKSKGAFNESIDCEAELGATSNKPVPTLEDKDFHVIDDDEIFFMDKFGVDQVFVSEDPLRIVDNHFCLPSEKTDLLRPPVHFPISEESYTLCEMTFTWHLFGGRDFPQIGEKPKTKGNSSLSTGAGMSETYKHGVSQAPNESHKNFKKINPDGSKISQQFIFSPALPICFDYHGRRIELSRGPITGLVMGLAQLQGSGISLREVINRRGLLGWNKLFEFLCKEWIKDIKRNQLPNILSGIGPTNAVLQLFQGFFDLFRLPLRQYNKDGRIIRGFQLGAQSFSARTAFAALEITSRIIHLLQFTAETTFDMLSAGPSLNRRRKTKIGKKRQGRPKDLREGVANAYTIVKEGINDSANTLLEAAVVEHDQKGYSGA
ncbi:hypothetical protein ACLKA6_001955, partial [Drosophila palustris]